ncbi:MAG: hypothetical protein ACE5KQ_04680 [Thermoplasmata archaeon]
MPNYKVIICKPQHHPICIIVSGIRAALDLFSDGAQQPDTQSAAIFTLSWHRVASYEAPTTYEHASIRHRNIGSEGGEGDP